MVLHLRCVAFAFVAQFVHVEVAEVEFNAPFQIVRPTTDHKSMTIVREGLANLQRHSNAISLLSVVGPYHSGKSFLLNSLLGDMKAFMIGRRTSPETMGIWLCRTRFKAADGSEVWLLDSEGFFGPGVEESYDAKVFTVATLLGSHVVYNTVKIIDQQAVSLLELLMTQAQLFGSRSIVRAQGKIPEYLLSESFPTLTWVVEDFVQELPAQFKSEGPIGFLTTYLEGSSIMQGTGTILGARGNDTRETLITQTFRDTRVAHLFLPATSREQLQDLSRLSWHELTEEYRSEVGLLQGHLLNSIKARYIGGRAATGPALAQALHFIINSLQQGRFQEFPSLWTSWTTQVIEMALRDADEWFSLLLQEIDKDVNPVSVANFNAQVESARDRAVGFYRNLIRDFNVRPQMTELRQRMDRHFDQKSHQYHERVRRWVADLLAETRDRMTAYLESFVLPMDPELLKRLGQSASESYTKNITSLLSSFSEPGRKLTLGSAATMPAFVESPSSQVANSMRTQLGARELENDREVSRIFKNAATAADDAVEGELKAVHEMLYNAARMSEMAKAVEVICWRKFDETLENVPWAKTIPKYATMKSQVRKDTLDSKMARFISSQEKRLKTYLQTGLQNALAAYKERVVTIQMPLSQIEIDTQHEQVLKVAREIFMGHGQEYSDTSAFKDVNHHFQNVMDEGRKQLQDKNVELWKVYSDGATRCAAAANSQRSANCSFMCLFSSIPWVHKSVSRRNLQECFAKDSISARMTPQLQAQVFEVWYSKDLGVAARSVSTRFIVLMITFFVVCGALWWNCGSRRYAYYASPWAARPSYAQFGWQGGGCSIPRQGGLQGACYPPQQQHVPQQGYCSPLRRRFYGVGGA
mmetsp:Transcript_89612/g.141448  ORF Transcript_89612/g.141448 Transcript_89612/m.141448 type:complete len:870 (-) Transcript_89612:259-2868(-)